MASWAVKLGVGGSETASVVHILFSLLIEFITMLHSRSCDGSRVYDWNWRLWQKFVAGSVDCYEVPGLRRFSFELLTQPQNMVVDRTGARIVLVAPHFIEQFVTRNHSSRILNQIFQSLKFHCRHRKRLSFAERGHL